MKYITKYDNLEFTFIQIPKFLFSNPTYSALSNNSKLMYGLILDRLHLSQKNNWTEEDGTLYLVYTIEETTKVLNCKKDTAVKVLKELEAVKLIDRKRRGQGLPSIIYVYNVSEFAPVSECENTAVKTSEKPKSRSRKNRSQEVDKIAPNNTDSNKIDMNNTNLSPAPADKKTVNKVNEMIDYERLCIEYGEVSATRTRDIIADVMTGRKSFTVDGKKIAASQAVSVFSGLNHKTVTDVLSAMSKSNVYSPTHWLPTALYNAQTMPKTTQAQYTSIPTPCNTSYISHTPSFDLDAIMEHAKNTPLRVRAVG